MKYIYSLIAFIFTFPYTAMAAPQDSIQTLGSKLIVFLNTVFVPFLFSVALLVFIYNIVQYFIIQIDNYDGREKAKQYALYSISAFVLMVSIWGIVNLFVVGIGLGQIKPVCSDIPGIPCDDNNGGAGSADSLDHENELPQTEYYDYNPDADNPNTNPARDDDCWTIDGVEQCST